MSESGQHTGRTNIRLSERGEFQAQELGRALPEIHFDRVLSSPLERALRSCELAGLTPTNIDEDLAEWDYGDYEGQRSIDICLERSGWNPFRDRCPGGEMPAQVSARADRVIAQVHTQGGSIALFSHGQFGCVLAARWIGLPVVEGQHFGLHTASLSILGYEATHADVPVIELWNGTSHETVDSRQ